MLGVSAQIFAVKKIAQQHTRLDVCTVAFNELKDGADTFAAMNRKMDICEHNM